MGFKYLEGHALGGGVLVEFAETRRAQLPRWRVACRVSYKLNEVCGYCYPGRLVYFQNLIPVGGIQNVDCLPSGKSEIDKVDSFQVSALEVRTSYKPLRKIVVSLGLQGPFLGGGHAGNSQRP